MKTWRDFNVCAIRRVFEEQKNNLCDENHLEKSEELFTEFMELISQNLNVAVPCLTCGVRFPINALAHECQEDDIWVNQYVHNAQDRQSGYESHIRTLQSKYPFQEINRVVYRGKNFETVEEYKAFLDSIKKGTLRFPTVTSWTTDYPYAVKFARFMQIGGTSATDYVRKKEIKTMLEEQANMTGQRGIVMRHHIRRNQVLCDIGDAQIGGFNEHEVILLPGTYRIEVVKVFHRREGNTNWNITDSERQFLGIA